MSEDRDNAERLAPQAAVLGAALNDSADPDVRDYLRAQTRLADLQSEDLKREDKLRHWSLRVRHVSDVLKLGFELALAFIVIAVAIGFGVEIWAAAHADGLVIDAFNVPPAMSERGLTGQVVASKLLDRLTVLQDETTSARAASSFANDWTNDIKVEIPDTGVSLGEVVRYLHNALGHEMHLSGEMYQTPDGVALTVRIDNDAAQTFTASSSDLDALVQRAAIAVYARAQPYRYSVYLSEHDSPEAAYAVEKTLAETGSPQDRAWAYIGMTNNLGTLGRLEEARSAILQARQIDPNLMLSHLLVANAENNLSHEQATMEASRDTLRFLQSGHSGGTTEQWLELGAVTAKISIAETSGDYGAVAQILPKNIWFQPVWATTATALDQALAHDLKGALATIAPLSQKRLAQISFDSGNDNVAELWALIAMSHQDWQAASRALLDDRALAHAYMLRTHGQFSDRGTREYATAPLLAVVYARMGEWAQADAELKPLPLDCDICVRARGKVEAIRRNWQASGHWFAMVSARSPDVPFADTDWGQMLMGRGDLDGAIAKFESAHRKGPHFADPLEMWGEALTRKNRSDLALAKFEEAAKYAPNWGRLHLKWGEALWWSGKREQARAQYATAAGLDLTQAERAELARMRGS